MDDSPWDDVPSKPASEAPDSSAQTENKEPSPGTRNLPVRPAGGRRRAPVKKLAQSTILEPADALDPLASLTASEPALSTAQNPTDHAPIPPQKERSDTRPPKSDPADQDVLSMPHTGTTSVQTQQRAVPPSVSIEQAARPMFDILVGDPHKVGDLTSSHIVYSVHTKTTSKAYRVPDFTVTRRYRDFLWLYNSLHSNNPGLVIPPPPEKQAVGRFDTEFVESRRQALERMLNKIATHPILHHDADLKIFLESEAFNVDIKNKENRDPLLDQKTSGGMLSAIGINVGSSSGGKFIEHDDWFHDRKLYLDALENQLKALMKALDTVTAQRKSLADAAGDFGTSLSQLAAVELSPIFSGPLQGLAEVQARIKSLYQRQAQQDILTLGITIDEYIRLIGSVKTAFGQRQKAFHAWHAAESELQKRRGMHDKLLRSGRSQQDKLNEVNAGVSDAEKKAHQARLLFEDMGRIMRGELERFEREKIEDFKSGVETFLEGAVEAQKELIELWETFLFQMDAEDEEISARESATTTTGDAANGQNVQSTDLQRADDTTQIQPDPPVAATATDMALEQES